MRVLVTGGAGFLGRPLAARLRERGYDVVVIDNLAPQVHGEARPEPPPGEFVHGDVRDPATVARVIKGVDVVHHLAAETGVGQSQYEVARYVGTNALGTAVVLEAALAAGVGHVVLASSRAVYGEGRYRCSSCGREFDADRRAPADLDQGMWDVLCPSCHTAADPLPMVEVDTPGPASLYGFTKLEQEQLVSLVARVHGVPVTILRPFNVFGPGQSLHNPYAGVIGRFFRQARRAEEAELYEDGRSQRDFVFVDEAVEAFVLATANEVAFGRTLNVGTGRAVELADVARCVFEAAGAQPRARASGRYRIGDVRHAVADPSRLEKVLGLRASTGFASGLAAYAGWANNRSWDADDNHADGELVAHWVLRQARGCE